MRQCFIGLVFTLGLNIVLITNLSANDINEVILFTTSDMIVYPSKSITEIRYDLDAPGNLIKALGRDLPNDLMQAKAVATARINSLEGKIIRDKIETGFNGVVLAWLHDIERLPAVMINDKYILYGITNIDQAIHIYKERVSEK